tara:strand:- start:258 stop:422 length:165 start_codon:yes stop_codon:yes gene_type:complete
MTFRKPITSAGMFKMLEKLNHFYFMLRGNKLEEKVTTEETINAFLVRKENKIQV